MFVATGLVGLIWLAPWLLLVRNDLPSKAELAQANRSARTVSFGSILSSPVVWGGMITNFCYGYFTFYCMTWMPAYLVEQRGLSLSRSGLYTFFSFAGIAIVAALAGWAADRIIARGGNPILVRKAFTIAGFMGGCTVLFGAYAPLARHGPVLECVFAVAARPGDREQPGRCRRLTLIPKQAIGLVTGVQQVATSLAGGVAASLSGWLLHVSGSYDLPMMVILAFLMIGALTTVILFRPEWAPKVTEAHGSLRRA